jgi:hypothetical protein
MTISIFLVSKYTSEAPFIPPPIPATHGWFGGGSSTGSSMISTVERITFATDTATASVRGPLASSRRELAATGNNNFGWFGGGFGPIATVDRITFVTDTATASIRGPLSSARSYLAATGNDDFGWFGGGSSSSRIDRIDFADDTPTASVRGPLSSGRSQLAATGDNNYGWFGGGTPGPTTTILSTVDRIDFAVDTGTASVRGPLSARRELAATGNDAFAWFGGGANTLSNPLSTVDRINLSNDTGTSSVRGPLSSARSYLAATGNDDFGWFGGGFPGSAPAPRNTVDRIDFASDTGTASVRGPLSVGALSLAATSGVL